MLSKFGLVETKAKAVKPGDVFSHMTVVAVGMKVDSYKYYAVCQCSCGSALKRARMDSLLSGSITSCGCYHRLITTTHGGTKDNHGKRWKNMMERCYNPKNNAYKNYGARGITVCSRWHDVANYVADIKEGYLEGLEIDRIENDKGYSPGNTRWTTSKVNSNNRRSCVMITIDGITASVTAHADRLGVNPTLAINRISSLGWNPEKALKTPVSDVTENALKAVSARWSGHTKKPRPPKRVLKTVQYNGQECTIKQLSNLCGVSVKLLNKRIFERNWLIEEAVIDRSFKGRNTKREA